MRRNFAGIGDRRRRLDQVARMTVGLQDHATRMARLIRLDRVQVLALVRIIRLDRLLLRTAGDGLI